MLTDRKLRVAIDCRIADWKQGIGTAVLALAKTLSSSPIKHQEYTFVVLEEERDQLEPYVGGPCSILTVAASSSSRVKSALRAVAPLRFLWKAARGNTPRVPQSNGLVEGQNFDVVHFPTQLAYLTEIPSIYQPWDLQHRHLPKFFSKAEIANRDALYGAFCRQATFVCVQADWTRRDVIDKFGIDEEKIVVIPWGSVFDAYSSPDSKIVADTVTKFNLPEQFFVYPAITWPHKNHDVILRALERLKLEGDEVPNVYFTGSLTPYRSTLEKLAAKLGLMDKVHFLGFLSPSELQSVFSKATAMLFPSSFEGFGLPILEAFQAQLPVLASSATTLPEVAQDGALFFDPHSPEQLAVLMKQVRSEPGLRERLIAKGSAVLARTSMQNTVEALQALYDRTASDSVAKRAGRL